MIKPDKNSTKEAYQVFLNEIVNLVQQHRVLAVQSVQTISNKLYWNIGELILQKQKEYGWGKSIVEQLSKDLPLHVGEGVSWSPRNLWFMRQLVNEYSNLNQAGSDLELSNMKQLVSEMKQLVSEIPWGHNILIFQKVKDNKTRIFYLQSTKQLPKKLLGKLPSAQDFQQVLTSVNFITLNSGKS
jgi:predicted nuclease of restriction endonuclease-like (RecB) superfamily